RAPDRRLPRPPRRAGHGHRPRTPLRAPARRGGEVKGGADHGPDAASGALPAEEGAARPRGGHPSAARPRGGHRSPPGLTRLTRLSRPTTRWTLRARLASALAPSLAALALAAGAVALGVGPASLGRS